MTGAGNRPKGIGIYARVSTDEQTNDNQLILLREEAEMRGEKVVYEYADVISGSSDHRLEFDRMMADASKGHLREVWVLRLDRFGRSLPNILNRTTELFDEGVAVRFLDQPFLNVDPADPQGRFMLQIYGTFAELERNMIRKRTREGLARARREGRVGGRRAVELTKEQKKTVERMIREGANDSEIVRELHGVSESTARRRVRASRESLGMPNPAKKPRTIEAGG